MRQFSCYARLSTGTTLAAVLVAILVLSGCITVTCPGCQGGCGGDGGTSPPSCNAVQVPVGGAGGCSSGNTCTNEGTTCSLGKHCKTVNIGGVCNCSCMSP